MYGKRKLVGFDNFKRNNPKSDLFDVDKFLYIEFWCGDATNTSRRFAQGLGMNLIAKSDQSTGNQLFSSYVLQSDELVFSFTAAAGSVPMDANSTAPIPFPPFNRQECGQFFLKHGLAARAIGIRVKDAQEAYNVAVKNGAKAATPPTTTTDSHGSVTYCEIYMYADVVLRFISFAGYNGPFMPHYVAVPVKNPVSYGIRRMDHAVSNVPNLLEVANYLMSWTGFHEFAEFTAEDVGTVDSGLNSMVLANNSEMVLLPFNEPTHGTKRKSQIQTFIEQNEGEGLQHFALKTDDVLSTVRKMREQTHLGGFDFMPRPSEEYYRKLPQKVGDVLTADQYKQVEELGLLVDRDDQGVLIQIFTKPLGDRMTCFIEIIQRLCLIQKPHEPELAGCGGFGKGNFSELFKSIEDYEKDLESAAKKVKAN